MGPRPHLKVRAYCKDRDTILMSFSKLEWWTDADSQKHAVYVTNTAAEFALPYERAVRKELASNTYYQLPKQCYTGWLSELPVDEGDDEKVDVLPPGWRVSNHVSRKTGKYF